MSPESAAERTDPLLPVISADLAPPTVPPALDDRRLAGLLADLDAEDLLLDDPPAGDRAVERLPAPRPPAATLPAPRPPAATLPAPRAPAAPARGHRLAEPLPSVVDAVPDAPHGPDGPFGTVDGADPPAGRYVRRDYQPPPVPAEAMNLTGLSRVTGSRLGTVLFTAFFLGIFVLILVEVVVSLLQASS